MNDVTKLEEFIHNWKNISTYGEYMDSQRRSHFFTAIKKVQELDTIGRDGRRNICEGSKPTGLISEDVSPKW